MSKYSIRQISDGSGGMFYLYNGEFSVARVDNVELMQMFVDRLNEEPNIIGWKDLENSLSIFLISVHKGDLFEKKTALKDFYRSLLDSFYSGLWND